MATPSYRKRAKKAYRVANKIFVNYALLYLGKWLFGKNYYQRRIANLHDKNARRIKETILELQGLFTKVGQLLSMMSSILPDQYMQVLESLQDKAPASPTEASKKLLEEELGESLAALFSQFDEVPIASASIGQVYKARLKTGELVAVKVQHPNIEELAAADLAIIQKLIKRVERFFKIHGLDHVYNQVSKMIAEELDYQQEARSMDVIKNNLGGEEGIIVPKVFTEYSSKRVLVTAFHEGVKINNTAKLDEWAIDRRELAERLILTYCKMIIEDGIYHADPHPGNVLVNKEGEIILLDFGAVAVLDEAMRQEIPVLIQAIIRKDQPKILASLQKMGFVGDDKEAQQVARKLINALSFFLQNEVKIENMNLRDIKLDNIKGSSLDNLRKEISIKEMTKSIRVPKDWILLERTLILVMGVSNNLDPKLNPMDVIKPYLKKVVLRDGGLQKMIVDAIKQQFTTLLSLPTELHNFLRKANNGELELEIRDRGTERIYAIGQQIMLAILITASFLFYYLSDTDIWMVLGAVFSLFLFRSAWKHRRQNG